MNSSTSRRAILYFQIIALALLAIVFWPLRTECLSAESAKQVCLSVLTPSVSALTQAVRSTFQWGLPLRLYAYSLYGAWGALGVLALTLLVMRSLPLWGFFYFVTVGLACGGEFFALRRDIEVGACFHICALATAFVAFGLLWMKDRQGPSFRWMNPVTEGGGRPRSTEILLAMCLFTLIVLARFHQLNVNPPAWDTESCGHRFVASSWTLMFQQELEMLSQQSSGLSWTVLHKLFTRYDDPLLFDLDQRLLGVGISFVCCWAVYFLMRYLRGPFAGLLGLVVYGFGPLDLQWSRLPTLHHLPVGIGMMLAWASFAAFSRRTWGSFGAVALLIVVTKFVYPSAKLIALGPMLGMLGVIVWENREWFGHRRKFSLIVLGLALFALVRSLIYYAQFDTFRLLLPFAQIQPVNQGESTLGVLLLLGGQFLKFVRSLFIGPVIIEHYTYHATTEPLRAIPSVCVVFMVLVFMHLLFTLRKPLTLMCLGLVVGGMVPALATGMEERRVSFVLVFLPLLSVLEFVWFVDVLLVPRLPRLAKLLKGSVLVLTAGFLWAYQTQAFFSRPAARPTQHLFNEALRGYLYPDTLVVNLSPEHDCSAFYGIYDLLKVGGGRIAYAPAAEPRGSYDPIAKPELRTNIWHYQHTELVRQIPTVASRGEWPRKLYVLIGNVNREDIKQRLRAQYPGGREILVEGPGIPPLTGVIFETAPPAL